MYNQQGFQNFQGPMPNQYGGYPGQMPPNNAGYPPAYGNQVHPASFDIEMQRNNNNADDDFQYNDNKLSALEQSVRVGFVKKVYSILSAQLIFTALMCMLSMNSEGFAQFQRKNVWLLIISCLVMIFTMIALVCCSKIARKTPTNYILLGVFTFCESYNVSFICSVTKSEHVMMAASLTLAIVIGLTAYAFYTKKDFTTLGGMLFAMSCCLLMFGLLRFFIAVSWLHTLYHLAAVILFSLYLIYDTQLIMGGKKHELSIDDYVIGALMLYVDIMAIFIHLLELFRK